MAEDFLHTALEKKKTKNKQYTLSVSFFSAFFRERGKNILTEWDYNYFKIVLFIPANCTAI